MIKTPSSPLNFLRQGKIVPHDNHVAFTRDNSNELTGYISAKYISDKRLLKARPTVPATEKKKFIAHIAYQLLMDEITSGEGLRTLRISVLGLKQSEYAK